MVCGGGGSGAGILERLGWVLLVPALTAFLAMTFTGASTYTSLSGVKKEMRWALPLEIGSASLGLVLWLGALFICEFHRTRMNKEMEDEPHGLFEERRRSEGL